MTDAVLIKLESLSEKAEAKLMSRQEFIDSKPNSWYETVRGQRYIEETDVLEAYIESLNETIDQLQSFLSYKP